ncbi:phosphatase PAP2 family protein [Sphingomonas sp. NSE70-1]|uniref:Phosphatase PAP2 family protein n=1 Tax=Sphingomonas caseinilyticus TaxID=2908205 RepID=A0ABT0RV79_9SPHN|nr:phosphatase PAP2 family protein [Sphingomonas caseinilyticus]MCL6698902.1 phosphatase PAP2 family protein [Sphingomonas caseinilyticus]
MDWVVPAIAIVAIEYVIALAIGFTVGFRYEIPTKSYVITTLTISSLILVAVLLIRIGRYAWDGEAHPTRRLFVDARQSWPRMLGIVLGCVLVGMQIGALTWLKTMLPLTKGFWADLPLAEADRMLFGRDPWIVSHELLGSLTTFLDSCYVTWAFVKFGTLIAVILAAGSRVRSRAMLAYFLTASTGCLFQYAMPSAGPVFYSHLGLGDQFAAMPIEPWVASARDYLWTDYMSGGGKPGGGISAMPSMHVAVALWVAFVARAYFPRLQWIGWIYFVAILVGSVHLGWHYAWDGIAASLIALGAWILAPYILRISPSLASPKRSSPLPASM